MKFLPDPQENFTQKSENQFPSSANKGHWGEDYQSPRTREVQKQVSTCSLWKPTSRATQHILSSTPQPRWC